MNRISLVIVTLLLATTTLSAQQYAEDYVISTKNMGGRNTEVEMVYGVMVGTNIPIMREKSHTIKNEAAAGFMGGIRWGVDLGGFEIVPELWYMQDRAELYNPNNDNRGTLKSHSFELPIVFGISITEGLRFNIAPSFALASNAKIEIDDDDEYDFGSFKSTFGYFVGMSYTAWEHWVLDLRYNGRFVSADNQWPTNDDVDYTYRYYGFSITAGYRF